MNFDPFNFIPGCEIDPLVSIMMGFVEIDIEVEPISVPGSGWQPEKYSEPKRELRLAIRVRFRGKWYEKKYLVSLMVGKIIAKMLSHKRKDAKKTLKVGAERLWTPSR